MPARGWCAMRGEARAAGDRLRLSIRENFAIFRFPRWHPLSRPPLSAEAVAWYGFRRDDGWLRAWPWTFLCSHRACLPPPDKCFRPCGAHCFLMAICEAWRAHRTWCEGAFDRPRWPLRRADMPRNAPISVLRASNDNYLERGRFAEIRSMNWGRAHESRGLGQGATARRSPRRRRAHQPADALSLPLKTVSIRNPQ